MNIYIVSGETGEYSDHEEWVLCAFEDLEKAKGRISELNNLMMSLGIKSDYLLLSEQTKTRVVKLMQAHNKGDPDFTITYTGVDYSYQITELL